MKERIDRLRTAGWPCLCLFGVVVGGVRVSTDVVPRRVPSEKDGAFRQEYKGASLQKL